LKKTKLTDIAKVHGVSVSTVSKALNGHSDISAVTRAAILATSKKMHYVPDTYARGLRTRKSKTIGVIIPNVLLNFNATVLKGILSSAKEFGYRVLLSESEHYLENEKETLQKMIDANVDGLLISINKESKNIDHIIRASENLPMVLFDKISDKIPLTNIIVDDEQGAFNAVEHLILQGRKKIVCICGAKNSYSSKHRLNGYLKALKKYNMTIDRELIVESDQVTIVQGALIVQRLLFNTVLFDAIFGITDNVAIGAIKALKKAGVSVPKEVSVVGFSDSDKATIVVPNLTSVSQPGESMGKIAVRYLIDEINNPVVVKTPKTIELKTILKIRESSFLN